MKNYLAADVVIESRGILVNGPDQLRKAISRLGQVVGSNIPSMCPSGGGSFAEKFEAALSHAAPAIRAATHWQLRIPAAVSDLSEENHVSHEVILLDIERLPDTDDEPYLVQIRLPMNFGSRLCEAVVAADLGVTRGIEAARVMVRLAKVGAHAQAEVRDRFEIDLADVVCKLGVSSLISESLGRSAAETICNRGNSSFGEFLMNALPNCDLCLTLANVAPPINNARPEGKVRGPLRPVEAKTDNARILGWLRPIPGMRGEYEHPYLLVSLKSTCRSLDRNRPLPVTDRYDQSRLKEQALQIAAAFKR